MEVTQFQTKKEQFLVYLEVERNMSSHTLRAYASDLQQFLQFWEKITHTERIPLSFRLVLERYFISLYNKKRDKSSIARKISCFKSFEKYVKADGIVLDLKLTRPRLDKKLPVYLSVDEIFHLLDTIKNEELETKSPLRDKAIFELLYATGIRCSELVGITLDAIDIDKKIIRVFGKGRKERLVLFGEKAKERLLAYLTQERVAPTRGKEHLFISFRNTPLTTRSVQRIIQMFRSFLKVKRAITPHKIRHSFATHLLNCGVDLRMVQELLGHTTIASTEKYTHITSAQLAQMCDTLHPIHTMATKKKRE